MCRYGNVNHNLNEWLFYMLNVENLKQDVDYIFFLEITLYLSIHSTKAKLNILGVEFKIQISNDKWTSW